jgi:hypothetical protein
MQAQTWKATPFTIEREEGTDPGTLIFRLRGPFTARDMFGTLAPVALDKMLSRCRVTRRRFSTSSI